ncbi:MAG: M20/M25/M40 family metallo-hydrolase [Candidatus Heimdallarchaeota archaeon]|nr:M20/M25/M40 family metallo-hydrolase [Candidatus Heimdallarchaeota archaeon]
MEVDYDEINRASIDLLRKLIQNRCENFDTIDSGNEIKNANALIKFFESFGIHEYEVFEPAEKRTSLLVKIKGTDRGKSLMYESHLDVVPETSNWTIDPFDAEIKDDKIYGRGALDMLYLTATQASAIAHLISSGWKPKGDLYYLAVADEEGGGKYGAEWLINNVPDKIRADYMIGEAGGFTMDIPNGKKKIAIMTSEKSPGFTKVNIRGTSGHGSLPYKVDNALHIAAQIIKNIENNPPKPIITDSYKEMIDGMELSKLTTYFLKSPKILEKILPNLHKSDPTLARLLHGISRMTVTPTVINGGNKLNVIPDTVELGLDIRLLPDQGWTSIESYLNKMIPNAYQENVQYEPIVLQDNISDSFYDPFVTQIQQTTKAIIPNAELTPMFLSGVTDARFFRKIGMKCYGYGLLGENFSSKEMGSLFHGDDEYVPLESMYLTSKFFTNFAVDFYKTN